MEAAHQERVRHEIPKGAIIMSKIEALNHQAQLVRNWKPQSDVWPLIYGRPILSGAAALAGLYINQRFRRKLKLRQYGLVSTIAGLVAGPTIATSLLYSELILNRLLLLEVPCPLCLESKSILLQTCTGLLFPLILAPLANFSVSEVNMGTDKSNFDFANYSRIKYITGSLLDVTQGPSSKEIPGTICVCNKNIYKR